MDTSLFLATTVKTLCLLSVYYVRIKKRVQPRFGNVLRCSIHPWSVVLFPSVSVSRFWLSCDEHTSYLPGRLCSTAKHAWLRAIRKESYADGAGGDERETMVTRRGTNGDRSCSARLVPTTWPDNGTLLIGLLDPRSCGPRCAGSDKK